MSPSHVAEPTYEAIRQRLKMGHWPMGTRLEAVRLAEDLGVSATPVRDSLNRLVGEGLVDLTPGVGFHVPQMTERGLRNLLDLHLVLMLAALRIKCEPIEIAVAPDSIQTHAEQSEVLFAAIATASGNAALCDCVEVIAARLHQVRMREPVVLPYADETVTAISSRLTSTGPGLSTALKRYHTARKLNVRVLLRE